MGAAAQTFQGEFLIRLFSNNDYARVSGLAKEFSYRFGRLGSQRCFKNHDIHGKLARGTKSLFERFGLADYANVVFDGENLAQSGAENGLLIRQENTNAGFLSGLRWKRRLLFREF